MPRYSTQEAGWDYTVETGICDDVATLSRADIAIIAEAPVTLLIHYSTVAYLGKRISRCTIYEP
jgi:hypothetical protein